MTALYFLLGHLRYSCIIILIVALKHTIAFLGKKVPIEWYTGLHTNHLCVNAYTLDGHWYVHTHKQLVEHPNTGLQDCSGPLKS